MDMFSEALVPYGPTTEATLDGDIPVWAGMAGAVIKEIKMKQQNAPIIVSYFMHLTKLLFSEDLKDAEHVSFP